MVTLCPRHDPGTAERVQEALADHTAPHGETLVPVPEQTGTGPQGRPASCRRTDRIDLQRVHTGAGTAVPGDRTPTTRGVRLMRTMTCRQLGGACDLELTGSTADEVIKAQDRHLQEAVGAGDTAHEPALQEMKGRWKHPVAGMGRYRKVKRDFAATADR